MKNQANEILNRENSVWDKYWTQKKEAPKWDYVSYLVWNILKGECGPFQGKKIIECGSGTGRISMRLTQEGAMGILLDKSKPALSLGKKIFSQNHARGIFTGGDLLFLPFKSESCDIVWNAGVLEHFSEKDQVQCLFEMARVCKREGYVLVICPYKSIFHRVGKSFLEWIGRWPFGYEEPVSSLAGLGRMAHLSLVKKEYSIGVFAFFVEGIRFILPGILGAKVNQLLRKIFIESHSGFLSPLVGSLDTMGSKLFGGYLLVSLFRKVP